MTPEDLYSTLYKYKTYNMRPYLQTYFMLYNFHHMHISSTLLFL